MRYHCWLIKYTLSSLRGRRNPSGMVKGVLLKVRLKVPQSPKKFARYARSKKSRFTYGTPKWCSYSRRDPQRRLRRPPRRRRWRRRRRAAAAPAIQAFIVVLVPHSVEWVASVRPGEGEVGPPRSCRVVSGGARPSGGSGTATLGANNSQDRTRHAPLHTYRSGDADTRSRGYRRAV